MEFLIGVGVAAAVAAAVVTAWSLLQKDHTLLRVYGPVAAMRYIAESQREKLAQYLERSGDGRPFALVKRSWIYRASKGLSTSEGFGTQKDLHTPGTFTLIPAPFGLLKSELPETSFKVEIGRDGRQFTARFPAMRSAGSFGAFGAHFTRAASDGGALLNADNGGFLDNTGEGGLSVHHLSVCAKNQEYLDRLNERAAAQGHKYQFRFDRTATSDGRIVEVPLNLKRGSIGADGRYTTTPSQDGILDRIKDSASPNLDARGTSELPRNLIVQIGPSLSGFRYGDGNEIDWKWLDYVCGLPDVAGIEVKGQQGAKPNDGGSVKKEKLTAELRALRGFSGNADYVSPERLPFIHQGDVFNQVADLCGILEKIQNLPSVKARGLITGYKMTYCGDAVLDALAWQLKKGCGPDYLIVDGAEGGTGAADPIMTDRVGVHTYEALRRTHARLQLCGVRDLVRLVVSGRIADAGDVATAMALGADYTNIMRGWMLSAGCIQAAECHSGKCPSGIATHHSWRLRALDPTRKCVRFANYGYALRAGVVKLARVTNVRLDRGETFDTNNLFVSK